MDLLDFLSPYGQIFIRSNKIDSVMHAITERIKYLNSVTNDLVHVPCLSSFLLFILLIIVHDGLRFHYILQKIKLSMFEVTYFIHIWIQFTADNFNRKRDIFMNFSLFKSGLFRWHIEIAYACLEMISNLEMTSCVPRFFFWNLVQQKIISRPYL